MSIPLSSALELELKLAEIAGADVRCDKCGHLSETLPDTFELGKSFMEFLYENAHYRFWNGLVEIAQKRGSSA